jgi:hypothetical protein
VRAHLNGAFPRASGGNCEAARATKTGDLPGTTRTNWKPIEHSTCTVGERVMPLIWTSIIYTPLWTPPPPAPPRVARAAVTGIGWLVASEVAGGWCTTFVADPEAADPAEYETSGSFQSTRVDWHAQEVRAKSPPQEVAAISERARANGARCHAGNSRRSKTNGPALTGWHP